MGSRNKFYGIRPQLLHGVMSNYFYFYFITGSHHSVYGVMDSFCFIMGCHHTSYLKRETNCSKNMEEVTYCSKGKVVETYCTHMGKGGEGGGFPPP